MEKEELLELYEARGEPEVFEQAKALYEQALGAHPDDARARNGYGYLLECHGRREIRAALGQYERAAELEPTWTKPRYQLISACAALQQADDAVARFEPAEGLDGHRLLATAYLHAGRDADAFRVVDEALARYPDDPVLTELRGDVAARRREADEALALWQRAHELDPENLSSVYSRAFLLERLGRIAEAAEAWSFIVDWSESRGFKLTAEWPRRELARLNAMAR